MTDDYFYIDVQGGDQSEETKFKTPEERYAAANALYLDQCRDQDSYKQLNQWMPRWTVMKGMSPVHLRNRGQYELYPQRMVSFGNDKHGRPVFLRCAQCSRQHCTDAWLPFSYSSVWDRVRMSGDGSHNNPYLYWCRDVSQCLPSNNNNNNNNDKSPVDKTKQAAAAMGPRSLHYSCASQW